jgi:dipeptidyl aminopeptidase/acylaminoacyl peptidase
MLEFPILKKMTIHVGIFVVVIFCFLIFNSAAIYGQASTALNYQIPPKPLADLLDAPPTPSVSIDPLHQWILIQERPNLISIDELAQPELRLAGRRINPKTHGPSRGRYFTALKLLRIKDGKEFEIKGLPKDRKIRYVRWSPDGSHIAFIITKENGQDLWVVDVKKRSAKKLVSDKVSSTYGSPCVWLPDNNTLVCKILPENIGESPVKSTVPSGPVIQKTSGKKAPARTYQDLLKNSYDEALFEHHFKVRLLKVKLDGEKKIIGNTGIIRRIDPSPNGKYFLVETVHKPFSYLVPAYRFPYRVEIWDLDGKVVKGVADLPLAEGVPIAIGSVPTGPRSFDWRSDMPATLYWVEAQDGGDPKTEAEIRDKIFTLKAPFNESPEAILSLELRYSNVLWGNKNLALVHEWWWENRRIRSWKINPAAVKIDTTLLFDYSWQDRYNDPGDPLMKPLPNGHSVLLTDTMGNSIFLVGEGASPEGNRPFIDLFDLSNKDKKRLWRSEAPYFERPIKLFDINKLELMTRRESINEPPNYFIRDLKENKLSQVTRFPHPTPQLTEVQKELIQYKREDKLKMDHYQCLCGHIPRNSKVQTLLDR